MWLIGTLTNFKNKFSIISKSLGAFWKSISFMLQQMLSYMYIIAKCAASLQCPNHMQLPTTFVLIELSIDEEVQCGDKQF
jgi:hypothetical protein